MRRAYGILAVLSLSFACQRAGVDAAGTRPVATDPHGPKLQAPPIPPSAAADHPQDQGPSASAIAAARTLYQQRCALCHGASGMGDGIAAVNLRPTPQSLRDPIWQREVRDEAIAAIIVKGGAAVGKSLMMPPNRDLADDPEMVAALVAVVRSFAER